MTRKEQIIAASIDFNEKIGKLRVIGGSNILSEEEYIALNKNLDFIAGALWADENPKEELVSIDRVIEFIKNNLLSIFCSSPTLQQIANYFAEDFKKYFKKDINNKKQ